MSGARIFIAGAGAFGSALAIVLARAGRSVILWTRDEKAAGTIRTTGENASRLPGQVIPKAVHITSDPAAAAEADMLLLAAPAQHTSMVLGTLVPFISPDVVLVACAKGVEQETGRLQSAILADMGEGAPVAALSGPGFAGEIAEGLPTAVTIAAENPDLAATLCGTLSTPTFRPYASTDLIGVEIGGAIKNVLAIACGVVAGRKLGESARAALIARGLAEMTRLGVAMGARAETFTGLSGLGDLVLTATSEKSRNMRFGLALGEGQSFEALIAPDAPLAEGVFTAGIADALAKRHGVEMPITTAVAAVVVRSMTIDDAIDGLISRPLTAE